MLSGDAGIGKSRLVGQLVAEAGDADWFTAIGHCVGQAGSSLAYAASKAGVVNLTRNLARALAPEVRVNAVAPGLVDTPWTRPWPEERKRGSIEQIWLGRMCRPEEVAEVIVFLCAGASYVTGETVAVDGGRPR